MRAIVRDDVAAALKESSWSNEGDNEMADRLELALGRRGLTIVAVPFDVRLPHGSLDAHDVHVFERPGRGVYCSVPGCLVTAPFDYPDLIDHNPAPRMGG